MIRLTTARKMSSTGTVDLLRKHALNIFNAAVNAVLPDTMVHSVLRKVDGSLVVANEPGHSLKQCRVSVVGFGKAVIGMARAVEDILEDDLQTGYLSVPTGTLETLRAAGKAHLIPDCNGRIIINEGATNNLPDEDAMRGAEEISRIADGLTENDILLVLISGGGSALLPAPIWPITLQEKCDVTKMLANQGADIIELNTVRKRLSYLKGGRLAIKAKPAKVIALILSDVVGNPIDQIASGPTAENRDKPGAALEIVRKYGLGDQLPESVLRELQSNHLDSTVANKTCHFDHVHNFLVGSNQKALHVAHTTAANSGYRVLVLSHSVTGEAKRLGEFFSMIARLVIGYSASKTEVIRSSTSDLEALVYELRTRCAEHGVDPDKITELLSLVENSADVAIAVLSGGEPWVQVKGRGIGGRNQECALSCGINSSAPPDDGSKDYSADFLFLSAGSDGIDGPTSAAGAMTYCGQMTDDTVRCDAVAYLTNNDSNSFYRNFRPDDLVVTGITGTNVMDLHILLVRVTK